MRAHGNVLVFDKGDEVLETLQRYVADEGIASAWFQAIGAFERSVIAYWNRDTKQYEDIPVGEQVEVLALSGNVTPKKTHAHVVLGRRNGSTIGGHLKRGIVYPTLELHLSRFEHELTRTRDEETGLDLIR
ncbi:MAG TPA: PPC domain-containing DNA-binding protein [Thermoanaerobaculia bacterium]|nr:PPC domain-containing DNA-binding protein [Thermoanaerobaculia bacterium]